MYRPPPSILRKSAGAFDLPSIITGVVVVGILAAGVLAAIFGVIPFAQDRGAKQDLSSIRTAEGVAKAKDNRFMDHQRLLDIGYLQLSSTENTKVKADTKGTCYVGIAKSGTGTLFYSTDANTDPAILEADTDTGCLTEEELAELIDDVGGIDVDPPDMAPRNLKLTVVSSVEARATWDPVSGATGYKVEYRVGDAGEWKITHEDTSDTAATLLALPNEIVSVRVYGLNGKTLSGPVQATVVLPYSTILNPGFEDGLAGWGSKNITVDSATRVRGARSVKANLSGSEVSQTITVSAETPVLTYWSTGTDSFMVTIDGAAVATSPTGSVSGSSWAQRTADLSAYVGKTVILKFTAAKYIYLDEIAMEAK